MADLSPAAQAVLDAFGNTSNGEYIEGVWIVNEQAMLAAALRAAMEHLETISPWVGHLESTGLHWAMCELKSIITELEGTNG